MDNITRHPKSRQVVRVLQITDTHLYASSSGCLLGLNTEQSLAAVIARAKKLHMPADLILATGDLVHEGKPAAYHRIFSALESFDLPVYCLPGNHDERVTLQRTLGGSQLQYVNHAHHGDWHLVLLDSTLDGSEGGHLSNETLLQLETQLQSSPDKHTLICLHHQPVLMGSRWLDTMAVDNRDEFFAVIDRHPQVRGILWGHVHQQYDAMRRDVQLMASPSTCVQFLPNSPEFTIDMAAPGYRWLLLHEDGRIETGVERLEEMTGVVDMASAGY